MSHLKNRLKLTADTIEDNVSQTCVIIVMVMQRFTQTII